MEAEYYLDDLDNLTELNILKWRTVSKMLFNAITTGSDHSRSLTFSLYKISQAMGEFSVDLLEAFENNPRQAHLIETIYSTSQVETIVKLLLDLDLEQLKHHQAVIFLGIITCKHLEMTRYNHLPAAETNPVKIEAE